MVRWDFKVNWKKTRVIKVTRKRSDCGVKVEDQAFEQVEEMEYLGAMMSTDGRMQEEVEVRIGNAIYEIDWRNE